MSLMSPCSSQKPAAAKVTKAKAAPKAKAAAAPAKKTTAAKKSVSSTTKKVRQEPPLIAAVGSMLMRLVQSPTKPKAKASTTKAKK